MFKDTDDKWTRERSFWEKNGAEIGILAICGVFGLLMVAATVFVLTKPEIPGLSNIFKPPPPEPPRPSVDQKFHYSLPGEAEVLILPGKPVQLPMGAAPKPQEPPKKP